MMEWWLAYLAIGLIAGFLAGLLGIGGGALIVPMLVFVFTAQRLPPEHLLHVALGTSMATIVFTSLSSMRAHHAHGAVDWRIARALAPGMLAGSFGAALLAGLMPTRPLAMLFTALVFVVGTQLLLDLKPRNTRELPGRRGLFRGGRGHRRRFQPGGRRRRVSGHPVPRLVQRAAAPRHRHRVGHRLADRAGGYARATSCRAGTRPACRKPAWAMSTCRRSAWWRPLSMLAAPFGARLAHRLPVKRLRMVFALMFYALALRMLTTLW